ncbi:MAG: DUF2120 domain-containing protein [Methanobacterium sp.]
MRTHKIAGSVMETLEAFQGSRPAIDSDNILIVRGMSRKNVDDDKMDVVLLDLFKKIGARETDIFSEEGGNIIGIMDERIRGNVEIQSETDFSGIGKMKNSLETMGCKVNYVMGVLDDLGVFIVTWKDKSGVGPLFVEVVVAILNC